MKVILVYTKTWDAGVKDFISKAIKMEDAARFVKDITTLPLHEGDSSSLQ